MGLERLSSVSMVAKFLDTPEETVLQFLEEGRLGGVMLAALRRKDIAVTPQLKSSVQTVIRTLTAPEVAAVPEPEMASALTLEATVTIMFTDIVESTSMGERLGDWAAREIIREHDEIVRRQTKAHGGTEVKSMGDGFMLTFPSAHRGVACAVAIQRDLARYNAQSRKGELQVRIGLCVGEPIQEGSDFFGTSVALASRIAAKAKGGQVLVSDIVHTLVGSNGSFSFDDVGGVKLKGISGTQMLFQVLWRQS